MDSKTTADIIALLHFALVCVIVYAPFAKDKRFAVFYILIMPFLFWHWSINDDTCALTELEYRVRGIEKKESFFHKLISPVYKMEENDVNRMAKTIMMFLLYVSMYRIGLFRFEKKGMFYTMKTCKTF